MEYLGIIFMISFCMCYFIFFEKKLLLLLSLEGVMLSCIFLVSDSLSFLLFFCILIYFSVFMVIDSVLGLSLLIHKSRNSSSCSALIDNF